MIYEMCVCGVLCLRDALPAWFVFLFNNFQIDQPLNNAARYSVITIRSATFTADTYFYAIYEM